MWQARFWEHRIRDERDYEKHVDYIHFNPLKHEYVSHPRDWPWSSFHRFAKAGCYDDFLGREIPRGLVGVEWE